MRCSNCTIECQFLRRHPLVELPLQLREKLNQWLSMAIELPLNGVLCHACFVLLNSSEANRVLGHVGICLGCGRSVNRSRQFRIQPDSALILQFPSIIVDTLQGITPFLICHGCSNRVNRNVAHDRLRGILEEDDNIVAAPPVVLAPQVVPEPLAVPVPPPAPISPAVLLPLAAIPTISLRNFRRASNTSVHCVFHRCPGVLRLLIPLFIRRMLLTKHNFYIPRSARVCDFHLNANQWEQLLNNPNASSSFNANQIEDIIELCRNCDNVFNFENVQEMPNHICHYWTSLTVTEFQELFNTLPQINVKKPKMALALYLAKLRTGESDRRLSSYFDIKRSTLQRLFKKVRNHMINYYVPRFLGFGHMTHQDIANRNLNIPNALFGNPEAAPDQQSAIAIFDGTYVYLQKSSNYLFQRRTYSLHKYDNLCKPFMIVCTDGHIIDVVGPYSARHTDAEIMNDLFEHEESPCRQLFRENDIFILDRGFRDSIQSLESYGFQIKKPESVLPGHRQYTTLQANRSRCVTLCRWVVEVVNGRFKRDFKLLRQRFFNLAATHLMADIRIAAALLNHFHPVIVDSPIWPQIIERVNRNMNLPNHLGQLIIENNLNRRQALFFRIDSNNLQLDRFPTFMYDDLLLLALGPYQVKQARSYFSEHTRRNGTYSIEVCVDPERAFDLNVFGGNRPFLLRGRVSSRHSSTRTYYTYVLYDEEPAHINPIETILGHYCSCIVGMRTVGCCCHVMTVIWYLGWARHQANINPPAAFLDNVLVQLNEY